jgi:hypothetical protein
MKSEFLFSNLMELHLFVKTNRIAISVTVSDTSNTQDIHDGIKNNACWWSEGLIGSDDFLKGIQHLIQRGVI